MKRKNFLFIILLTIMCADMRAMETSFFRRSLSVAARCLSPISTLASYVPSTSRFLFKPVAPLAQFVFARLKDWLPVSNGRLAEMEAREDGRWSEQQVSQAVVMAGMGELVAKKTELSESATQLGENAAATRSAATSLLMRVRLLEPKVADLADQVSRDYAKVGQTAEGALADLGKRFALLQKKYEIHQRGTLLLSTAAAKRYVEETERAQGAADAIDARVARVSERVSKLLVAAHRGNLITGLLVSTTLASRAQMLKCGRSVGAAASRGPALAEL